MPKAESLLSVETSSEVKMLRNEIPQLVTLCVHIYTIITINYIHYYYTNYFRALMARPFWFYTCADIWEDNAASRNDP